MMKAPQIGSVGLVLIAALTAPGGIRSLAQEADPFGPAPADTAEQAAGANDPFGDVETTPSHSTGEDSTPRRAEQDKLATQIQETVKVESDYQEPANHKSRGLSIASAAARKAADRINAILDKPLKAPLDYVELPLNQIASVLAEDYEIPIMFDRPALDALAISEETEITISLRSVTLRTALELMLREVEDLTYVIDNEVLLITSEDEAQQRLEVRVYRVDDLIRDPASGELDFGSLVDLLISSIEPDSWEENGTGEGEVQSMQPGMLVVAQTRRVHDQVAALLATLRKVKAEIEADASPEDEQAANRPTTRAFRIQADWGDKPEEARTILGDILKHTVAWKTEDLDEEDAFLVAMPDRVVARHTPKVLHEVQQTLKDLGYVKQAYGRGIGYGGNAKPTKELGGGGMF